MLRSLFRLVLWAAAALVIIFSTVIWWFVYRPLPQLDGRITVPGLQREVTVDRDGWGVPHLTASTVADLAEAQGYVTAQDRLWQMDTLRRVARGQLSEVFGPALLPVDREFRRMNFSRASERDYAMMDGETRQVLEAYARGVNRYIEKHSTRLPLEFNLLNYRPSPWQPTDSLVIACYMYETLTDTREEEMNRAIVTAKVGAELAGDLYRPDAAMDRFVVGDPNVEKDARTAAQADPDDEEDSEDAEDIVKAQVTPRSAPASPSSPGSLETLAAEVRNWLGYAHRELRQGLGSNNWVVSGAYTSTGKPLLANDMHLELRLPSIWYEAHLTAPGWNVQGFTLPGAPMVVVGHNDRIAWGFTNNGADVLDLYIETFNPTNPDEYLVNGKWRKAEVYDESIKVKGAPDEHLRLVVTRHGPVVHQEGEKSYAMRWTVLEPGALDHFYNWLGKAQNWDEFRQILRDVWGPAQNIVYADVDGNIGYVLGGRIPVRRKGHGEVPVPGDTDDYEWIGYIPFGQLPQVFNPASGLIVTANARVVGPEYEPYLTDHWEEPYRTARIYDLLYKRRDLRPEDMLKVQTDIYSYPEVFMAGQLAAAAKVAPPGDLRARKLIEQGRDWNGMAEANSVEVTFLHACIGRTLYLILEPYLGNNTRLYEWRKVAFLQRVLTERTSRWLPPQYKNYDGLLSAAADLAVKQLEQESNDANPEQWPWKRFHSLDMLNPIGTEGLGKNLLSITNQPQSGTEWSPRAAGRQTGPSERFVANLADWDDSILLITGGQSGQPGSEHYRDQFSYWFEGKPIYGPFSDAAEAKVRRHRLILKPAS